MNGFDKDALWQQWEGWKKGNQEAWLRPSVPTWSPPEIQATGTIGGQTLTMPSPLTMGEKVNTLPQRTRQDNVVSPWMQGLSRLPSEWIAPTQPAPTGWDPHLPAPGTYMPPWRGSTPQRANVPEASTELSASGFAGGQTPTFPPSFSTTYDPSAPWSGTPSHTPAWEATAKTWGQPPEFLEKVLGETGPFTPEAREFFQQVKLRIEEPGQMSGGGGWMPWANAVGLETSQPEAMIHELTHAWWEEKRQDLNLRRTFIEAVLQLADDPDTNESMRNLAHIYVYGDPNDPNFSEGMKTSAEGAIGHTDTEPLSVNGNYWNDWEMYAGLASGCKGDIRKIPPYLQQFYEGLFTLLPPEAPEYAFDETQIGSRPDLIASGPNQYKQPGWYEWLQPFETSYWATDL